jgi:hypothetical protein
MARPFTKPLFSEPTQPTVELNEPNIRMPDDGLDSADGAQIDLSMYSEFETQNSRPKAPSNFKELQTVLQQMDSHFIFPVGWATVGKTVAFYSMLRHLKTENSPGQLHPFNSNWEAVDKTTDILKEVSLMFQDGKLPRETPYVLGQDPLGFNFTRQANYEFVPKKSGFPNLRMTFVDLSGENYVEFIQHEKLPPGVDVFFKADGLSLTFLLMTTTERAAKDDYLFSLFLDHVAKHDAQFRKARAVIILTKWDEYGGRQTPENFVREWMPMTFAHTRNPANAIMSFSIGKIDTEADGKTQWLKKFESKNADELFKWIYQSITGKNLDKKSWWQRLLKSI